MQFYTSSIEIRINKLCCLDISVSVVRLETLLVTCVSFSSLLLWISAPAGIHNTTLFLQSLSLTVFLSLLPVFHSSYMQGEPYNLTTLNISVVSGPMQIFVVLNNLIQMRADNNTVRRIFFQRLQDYLRFFLNETNR